MDDRTLALYEKYNQILVKDTWEVFWAFMGTGASFLSVLFGIYFSQVAFAYYLGNTEMMIMFSYTISIIISTLETAGIRNLGNKTRSGDIKSSNALEHKIMTAATWGLFGFDILSNVYGLYIIIAKNVAISGWGWIPASVMIAGLSALMGGAEVIVGWQLRNLAVSIANRKAAKAMVDGFVIKINEENNNNDKASSRLNESSREEPRPARQAPREEPRQPRNQQSDMPMPMPNRNPQPPKMPRDEMRMEGRPGATYDVPEPVSQNDFFRQMGIRQEGG